MQLEPITYHDDQTKEVKIGRILYMFGRREMHFYMENLDERDHLEDTGPNGKVILKFIFKKEGMRMWNGVAVSRWGE